MFVNNNPMKDQLIVIAIIAIISISTSLACVA